MTNRTVTICGHNFESQEVNAFMQFEIILPVEYAYAKAHEGQKTPPEGTPARQKAIEAYLADGVRRFNRNVILPLLDLAFVSNDGAKLSKIMLTKQFTAEDFKEIMGALQLFTSSVTANSHEERVTRKTSVKRNRSQKAAA